MATKLIYSLMVIGAGLLSFSAEAKSIEVQENESIQSIKGKLAAAPDSLRVHLLSDLCYEYRLISQDSALHYGNQALALAERINYANGLAQANNDLGIIYADRMEVKQAFWHYNQALQIWQGAKDSLRIAAMFNKLGILNQTIGKLDSAAVFQFKALAVYEAISQMSGISQSLNNIAIIFFNTREFERSIEYHKKALKIRSELNDVLGIGSSLVNLGNIYFTKLNYDSAITYYTRAAPFLEKSGAKNHLSSLYNNLGGILLEKGDAESARSYFEKSIQIRQTIGDTKGLISSYYSLANLEFKLNNLKAAKTLLNQALSEAENHGVYSTLSDIHLLLMQVESKQGNYKLALGHSIKHAEFKDSVLNQASNKIVHELQTKYETEKKEQQIAIQEAMLAEQEAQNERNLILIWALALISVLLVIVGVLARNQSRRKQDLYMKEAEIKLQEALLSSSISSQENERKRFARDLHDGFGQMISVLNLNLKSLKKGSEDPAIIFENSSSVLDEMYKELKGICFNLMPETLIKNGVIDALKEFANRISASGNVYVVALSHGVEERLTDLQEITLYRISQEWVNNILKYSDATKITIQITKDENEITLLIEDNGSGFDKSILLNGKGNGWKNIQSRSNLLKGTLELDTVRDRRGNTLILNCPAMVETRQMEKVEK